MAMIPLVEYARRIGKSRNAVFRKYQAGGLKTAVKMGRDIWVDEDEPYIDSRIKTGDYIGWRYGYQYQKQRRAEKAAKAADQMKPIEADENGVILSGHARYEALKRLGYSDSEISKFVIQTDEQDAE